MSFDSSHHHYSLFVVGQDAIIFAHEVIFFDDSTHPEV